MGRNLLSRLPTAYKGLHGRLEVEEAQSCTCACGGSATVARFGHQLLSGDAGPRGSRRRHCWVGHTMRPFPITDVPSGPLSVPSDQIWNTKVRRVQVVVGLLIRPFGGGSAWPVHQPATALSTAAHVPRQLPRQMDGSLGWPPSGKPWDAWHESRGHSASPAPSPTPATSLLSLNDSAFPGVSCLLKFKYQHCID